jgi:glycosyltransferase involved in cell wall biosynthesis
MIVRDEAAMLPSCLTSAQGVVQEIIIVDTGSRDTTRDIAKGAGAKLFDFPWSNDFSAARNESLRHAECRWILVLDADERLVATPKSGELDRLLQSATFDCGMLRLHDAIELDSPPMDVLAGRARRGDVQLVARLFRNLPDLAFTGTIHENATAWLRARGSNVEGVGLDIVHYGATDEVMRAKGKDARNLALLRRRLLEHPDDVSAYGYLAHQLLGAGNVGEAMTVADAGWARVSDAARSDVSSIHRVVTARCLLLLSSQRFDEARRMVQTARQHEADNPDLAFFAGYAWESMAQLAADPASSNEALAEARDEYVRCVSFHDRTFAQSFVLGASTWTGQTRLGTIALLMGRPKDALDAFDAALASRPEHDEAKLGKAEAEIDLGRPAHALGQLEALMSNTAPDAWALASRATEAMGRVDDARLFAEKARSLAKSGRFVARHRATMAR